MIYFQNLLIVLFFLSPLPSVFSSQDDYINEAQFSCYKSHDTFSCFKYRALKYVVGVASGRAWPLNMNSSNYSNKTSRIYQEDDERFLKLVHLDDAYSNVDYSEELFEESRQMERDSESVKLIKFVKRQLEAFLKTHGLSVGLPKGARTIYEDNQNSINNEVDEAEGKGIHGRGKKKKLAILLPFLSLLSLIKVKVLLVPILLTVLFIKKILVLAALFLPSILATLKICKVPHLHTQYTGGEANSEYSSGYGAGYSAYGANNVYNKDWAASRAYGAYRPSFEQNFRTQNDGFAIPNVIHPVPIDSQAT